MTVAFVRQIGAESGVQLNPLRDNSEIPSTDNSDQKFGIIMRATRGRIDKAFEVTRANVFTKLGSGENVRKSALNEAWVHVVEALNNGAYSAVVSRVVSSQAKIKFAVVKPSEPLSDAGIVDVKFSAEETEPEDDFLLCVKHLECFNDGIKLAFHADEAEDESKKNEFLTVRVFDSKDVQLFEFYGSLNPEAKDDFGNSAYLPDVVASRTDAIELSVGVTDKKAFIENTSPAYGYDENGNQKWKVSDVLVCFDEGQLSYTNADYLKCRKALQDSPFDFAYISSGGSQAVPLLTQLVQLAYDTNRQLRFDVPGNLDVEAVIAFVKQLNLGASKASHLVHAFWCPCKSDDPTRVNAKGFFGVATLNIALACGRNAMKNAKGFAPKNYPVAGREWPINRTGMTQVVTPADHELSKLAKAKINPCGYEAYTGGGRWVFRDSLTCASVDNSMKKLISVADMSTSIDDAVTRAGKDLLQLPMKVAVKRMKDFLRDFLANAEASDWLVPSNDPAMDGKAYVFEVKPAEDRPYDVMIVNYWLRYDGTARQIFVTQTLTK